MSVTGQTLALVTFCRSGGMEPDLLNCPQCEARMLSGPRPLMRIFGDVRAFECPTCEYMILKYAAERISSAPTIRPQLDAAE
jgi:DNA-directed RNA polymerase subunit RPC12/RpoP